MGTEIGSVGTAKPRICRVEVLIDDDSLEALRPEWDELLDASGQRVYFLRWDWNHSWWQTLRPAHSQLFIVTCRDANGRLAGLAPFYWRRQTTAGIAHIREILFLGTGVFAQTSEYLDIIARRGWEQEVAVSVAHLLRQEKHWDRLCLNEVPANSAILPYFHTALSREASGQTDGEVQSSPCERARYVDTASDWESFKRTLGRTTRQNTQRLTRRLFENYACRFQRVQSAVEVERGMDALIRLHQARWQAKGERGSFSIPGVEALLRQAASDALAHSRLRLWTLTVDGAIAAVQLAFLDNRIAHCFQVGFDPAHAKDSIGKVMLMLCIKDCVEDPLVDEYDFMGGDQPYKDCWASAGRQNLRLVCQRSSIRSMAYSSMKIADRVSRSVARAVLPTVLKAAGHRMLERRHYAPVISPTLTFR